MPNVCVSIHICYFVCVCLWELGPWPHIRQAHSVWLAYTLSPIDMSQTQHW